jgi:hypothetical protein
MCTTVGVLNYEFFTGAATQKNDWLIQRIPLINNSAPSHRASRSGDHDGNEHEPDLSHCRLVVWDERRQSRVDRCPAQRLQQKHLRIVQES